MRILAVDPGEKRIGIALSDETATLASPLVVIIHVARAIDAALIVQLAQDHGAGLIVVGEALNDENEPTPSARSARKLADAIRTQTNLTVVMWDESGSTQNARETRIAMGVSRKRRTGHQDDLAAAYILQDYLDANHST
jgi:putative holliday junction resolvase